MARSCLNMGLDGHEVVHDSIGDGSLHKEKEARGVGEWVGQPQYQPAIIGTTQVLIGAHRPPMLPVKRPVHWKTTRLPASQGLSTLGGGYCHNLFPTLSPSHPYLGPVSVTSLT